MKFNTNCAQCPRLVAFLDKTLQQHSDYYCKPVPPFGDKQPRLLIVGLAPGMHGANKTGRPFTGDYAGIMLYETLHKFGFANKPRSLEAGDGLLLKGCRITNAVKCLPPQNKPNTSEINTCNTYLQSEISSLVEGALVLALGKIAHDAVLKSQAMKLSSCRFTHGGIHRLQDQRILIDSYHCSRYNTQTRRLTESMFHDIFYKIQQLLTDRDLSSAKR